MELTSVETVQCHVHGVHVDCIPHMEPVPAEDDVLRIFLAHPLQHVIHDLGAYLKAGNGVVPQSKVDVGEYQGLSF